MIIKGQKTNSLSTAFLSDLARMKAPHVEKYHKKNKIYPFEDATSLEFFSNRSDSSLFALASHNKKRPSNITLGRMFNYQMLDMVEFGLETYKGIDEFKGISSAIGSKPCMVFNGEGFEHNLRLKLLKSLLLDIYKGYNVKSIDLTSLDHVISVTAISEDKVTFRHYNIQLKKSPSPKVPQVHLDEIGPSFDMVLRRFLNPSPGLRREAMKVPKEARKRKVKNISTNIMKEKLGQIHMERQDLSTLQTRKMKGLKRSLDKKDKDDNDGGSEKKKNKTAHTE